MLCINICCKLLASEVLHERSTEMDITWCKDRTEGRVIYNLPATALYPSIRPVASIRSSKFQLFGFHKKQLADK